MNLGIVIQSESGNVCVRHQAARFSGGMKTFSGRDMPRVLRMSLEIRADYNLKRARLYNFARVFSANCDVS